MDLLESLLNEFFDPGQASSKIVAEINALPEADFVALTGIQDWDDSNKVRDAWIEWENKQSSPSASVVDSFKAFKKLGA